MGTAVIETEVIAVKVCSKCKCSLPLSEFNKDSSKPPFFLASRCRGCNRQASTEWKARNPARAKAGALDYYYRNVDRLQVANREWKARNAERVRAANALYWSRPENIARVIERARLRRALKASSYIPFTDEQLLQKLSMWSFRCWLCNGQYESIDHVKPLSKGGLHMLANLRPACRRCNASKRASWPFSTARRFA